MGIRRDRIGCQAVGLVAPSFLLFIAHAFFAEKLLAQAQGVSTKLTINSSSTNGTFLMSTVRLNSLLKLYPRTLPINGSFMLLIEQADQGGGGTGDKAPSTTKSAGGGSPFVRHLSVLVTKSDSKAGSVAGCSVQYKSNNASYAQQVVVRWTLSPNSLHCTLYKLTGGIGGVPLAANVTTFNASLHGQPPYFISFHLQESDQECVTNFEVCERQSIRLPFECQPRTTFKTLDFANESQPNYACLQRIEYDSHCCRNCTKFCPQQDNFPTPPHFPLGKSEQFSTTSSFLVQSVPKGNLTAESKINQQNIINLLGESMKNLTENDENLTDASIANFSASNVCDSKPCLNDGLCLLNLTQFDGSSTVPSTAQVASFHCRCVGPYFGPKCQFVNQCEDATCLNGGTCRPLNVTKTQSSSNASATRCLCPRGFTGPLCGSVVAQAITSAPRPPALADPCVPNPCRHHGTCLVAALRLNDGADPQWPAGPKLLSDSEAVTVTVTVPPTTNRSRLVGPSNRTVTVVAPTTDSNWSGRATVASRRFRCQCPDEWSGDDLCGSPTIAATTTSRSPNATPGPSGVPLRPAVTGHPDCRRDGGASCGPGRCEPQDGSCNCANSGFTGQFCEKDVNECKNSPCKNNATCTNTVGSFNCSCTPEFSGPLCLVPATGPKSRQSKPADDDHKPASSNVGAIVGGVLGALALIGLVVGGYFLYKYVSRSRKLKGKYNPAREEMNNVGGHPVPMTTLSTGERLI